MLKLGGPLLGPPLEPDAWVRALREADYQAAYCPVDEHADDDTVAAYARAAEQAGIVIAETHAWSNPISPDEQVRSKAIAFCEARLDLAERIGARCCVNVSGTRAGTGWAGPHPDNLTTATFDLIVQTVRTIIDAVRPKRTCFTLETMPWSLPDSIDSYLALINAIDRRGFAVHLDLANLVNCPSRYYAHRSLMIDCVQRLGPWIRSCHIKDIRMSDALMVHIDECPPGEGQMDLGVLLAELSKLEGDTPVMLEHLSTHEAYQTAANHLRKVAEQRGIEL